MLFFHTQHPATGERLEVEARYQPPWRGGREANGAPLEPDDPQELEIIAVHDAQGNAVPLAPLEHALLAAGWRAAQFSRIGFAVPFAIFL